MTIEGKDFRLSNDGESTNWDLQIMRIVRPRGKPEREELSDPLYGMPLERAIQIIINSRLNKKQTSYELAEFLSAYRDQLNLLKQTLKSYGIEETNCSDN